ncbi:MAG: GNAT family N-acetyltransferase [Planctomycetaceae bacterium]
MSGSRHTRSRSCRIGYIRPAHFGDWPIIVEFNCRLAEESEGKRLDRGHVEPGVKAVLSDPRKGRYLVAVVDSRSDATSPSPRLLTGGESATPPGPAPADALLPPLAGSGSGLGGQASLESQCFGAAERIVGQLMHTHEWSDWRNGDIWWLQSVYVLPEYRRQGVFRALLEHLRNEAQADPGVVGLRLYVEEHNIQAQRTYAKLGLQPGGYFVLEQMLRHSNLSSK